MGWADLISTQTEQILPWTGGRRLVGRRRKWTLSGALPDEVGWHRFAVDGSRRARWLGKGTADPDFAEGRKTVRGYLIGDRLIPDGSAVRPDVRQALQQTEPVCLVEGGLDRFARVLTARSGGRLIYLQQEFPQGPELEVIEAWQDRAESIAHIPGVSPALELAFLWLVWQRRLAAEARQRREAAARQSRREAERARRRQAAIAASREAARQHEVELQRYRQGLDAMAAEDRSRRRQQRRRSARSGITSVLEAALSRSGSELLDHRPDFSRGQLIVQFRFRRRRFECVVNSTTLQVVDSGICLTDEYTGERGDTRFTLESLPPVIGQAMDEGVLHVYRHVR